MPPRPPWPQSRRSASTCATLDLEAIKDVYTFWDAEKRVVSSLKERLLSEIQSVNVESVAAVASDRKAGHWLSGPGSEAPERRAIADAYDAIVAAAELFALQTEHRHALSFETPGDLLAAYQKDLYQFDRLYRRFCTQGQARARSRLGSAQDPGRRGRAGLRPGLPAAAGDRVEPVAGRGLSRRMVARRAAGPAGLLRRQHPARTSPSRSASAPSSSSAMPFATKPPRSSPSRSTVATG